MPTKSVASSTSPASMVPPLAPVPPSGSTGIGVSPIPESGSAGIGVSDVCATSPEPPPQAASPIAPATTAVASATYLVFRVFTIPPVLS